MNQNNLIQAVAWDVDGTLIDSEWLHDEAVFYALKHLGIELDPEISMLGLSWDNLWKKIGQPANDFEEFAALCTDYYVKGTSRLSPRENSLEIVMQIAALGLPQIAVSNSQREIVEANIACLDLQNIFVGMVTREDVQFGKPDPAIYKLAAAKLGFEPAKVVAVEDSPLGAAAAYRAGLQTLFWPQDQNIVHDDPNPFYHRQIGKIEELLGFARIGNFARLSSEMFGALRAYGSEKYAVKK